MADQRTTTSEPPYRVLVLVYPDADLIDFSGPVEIFSDTRALPVSDPPAFSFKVTTVARGTDLPIVPVASLQAVKLSPDLAIADALARLDDFDVLVVPGAGLDTIQALLDGAGAEHLDLIRRFAALAPRASHGKGRVLLSVCSGAILLGAAGVLAGREATTHHFCFDMLDKAAEGKATVLRGRRWVDGGLLDSGVRVVTAGGVSSGFDAALSVAELFVGREAVEFTAEVVEWELEGRQGWGAVAA